MEKYSDTAKRQFHIGLLKRISVFFVSALFLIPAAHPQTEKRWTQADADRLEILPKEEIFFTNSEAQFILRIPNALPSEVQTELPNFPDGTIFNSSKREDYISPEGIPGTEIDLWFTFRQTGSVTLPPLIIYVQGRRYGVKFKTVEVYENPRTILPRLTVVFTNGKIFSAEEKKLPAMELESGKPVRFTLYLQYSIQVQQFGWDIPKDSLFREINRFDLSDKKQRPTDFTTEKIPLSTFEWTPLLPGVTSLPVIRMMVTAYSGRAVYLSMPDAVVTVVPSKDSADASKSRKPEENSAYAYAFTQAPGAKKAGKSDNFTVFDCKNIADLRSMERHSLLSTAKIRAERIAAEAAVGIQNSQNETRVLIFFILLFLNAISLIIAVIFFALKKRFAGFMFAVACLTALFFTILSANSVFKKYGIVTGGYLRPVPEDSALTKTSVTGGSRVLITQEIQNWYYIEYNESGGWIKKENLAVIK